MTGRDRILTITNAAETGFIITENDDPIAAFSTAAEACNWIENQLRALDPPASADEDLPRVLALPRDAAPKGAVSRALSLVSGRS